MEHYAGKLQRAAALLSRQSTEAASRLVDRDQHNLQAAVTWASSRSLPMALQAFVNMLWNSMSLLDPRLDPDLFQRFSEVSHALPGHLQPTYYLAGFHLDTVQCVEVQKTLCRSDALTLWCGDLRLTAPTACPGVALLVYVKLLFHYWSSAYSC